MDDVYKGGVFVAQPVNMTAQDVQKIKANVPGAIVLAYWNMPSPPLPDLTGDGIFDGGDLATVLGNWGLGR
jgi:hypothetical protein